MKLTRLLAMLLALIFAVSAFAACTEDKGNTPDDGTTAADTTAEPEDTTPAGPIDDYSANPFTPEVYDPNADNEMLDIFGAAYSDGDNGVIYGKCAVGATVTVTLPDGEFSVQSEGGRFAIRVHSATSKLEALNPMSVISRGYSAVFADDGRLIKSVDQVSVGDRLNFKTVDGTVSTEVKGKVKNDGK